MKYTELKQNLIVKNNIVPIIQIIIGTMFISMGTAQFLLPNQLSSGGFSGIATIIYYFYGLPMGLIILLLNIPLFLISFLRIGKKFFVRAIIGTVLLSVFIDIFETFSLLTTDRLLASIYGGIIVGIGTSLVLKANASTGGTELLTHIIQSYRVNIKISSLLTALDIIVVIINVIVFKTIEIGLYSAITIYIMGKMVDIVFEGIDFTKMMYIVSEKYQEISDRISIEVQRGTTGIYSKGMYTNKDKVMLLCVVGRNQVGDIKRIVEEIDKKAFIIISNTREVLGKGFDEKSTKI